MLTPLPWIGSIRKSATSSRRSSVSSASRSPNSTGSKPGRSSPNPSRNSGHPFAESDPNVSPWKPWFAKTTRGRRVAALAYLSAASTASVPELVKTTRPRDDGSRSSSARASRPAYGETPSCGASGRSAASASASAARTAGFERPTLNIPNPPTRSR